jgi:hypothetical protein
LRELKAAEAQDAAEGRAPLSESKSTASAFMKAGLQLEESQYVEFGTCRERELTAPSAGGV